MEASEGESEIDSLEGGGAEQKRGQIWRLWGDDVGLCDKGWKEERKVQALAKRLLSVACNESYRQE